jgi:hypothetical protein
LPTVKELSVDALGELLEEKGILTTEEWEAKIKERVNA